MPLQIRLLRHPEALQALASLMLSGLPQPLHVATAWMLISSSCLGHHSLTYGRDKAEQAKASLLRQMSAGVWQCVRGIASNLDLF